MQAIVRNEINNDIFYTRRVKQLSLEFFSQTQFNALIMKTTTNLTKLSMWKTRREAGMAKNGWLSFS